MQIVDTATGQEIGALRATSRGTYSAALLSHDNAGYTPITCGGMDEFPTAERAAYAVRSEYRRQTDYSQGVRRPHSIYQIREGHTVTIPVWRAQKKIVAHKVDEYDGEIFLVDEYGEDWKLTENDRVLIH